VRERGENALTLLELVFQSTDKMISKKSPRYCDLSIFAMERSYNHNYLI
jgi:hypothetical protein